MFSSVTAYANANIALIKYWGKLDPVQNIPQVGSLSLTLDCFGTQTKVQRAKAEEDQLFLNGIPEQGLVLKRVQRFLEHVRTLYGIQERFLVESINTVPTAAGLASSSSGFAALTCAVTKLIGLDLSAVELSQLARHGSGSAARSIWQGFSAITTSASCLKEVSAYPIVPHPDLDVCLVVVECASGPKPILSTDAMQHTKQTSPYYHAWVDTHAPDLQAAMDAVQNNRFEALGEKMEHSTLKMHACMMASSPPILYFEPLTLQLIQCVQKWRKEGLLCYFTIDAGPHVKILCQRASSAELLSRLKHLPGIVAMHLAGPGAGACLVEAL